MNASTSSQNNAKLAESCISLIDGMYDRLQKIETDIGSSIAKTTHSLIDKQQRWLGIHNQSRAINQHLAWQVWYDMHGGGVYTWTYFGHDVQISISFDYFRQLASDALLNADIDIELTDSTLSIGRDIVITPSSSRKDLVTIELSGEILTGPSQSAFKFVFDGIIQFGDEGIMLFLARGGLISIQSDFEFDLVDIQSKFNSAIIESLLDLSILDLDFVDAHSLIFHSVHLEDSVSCFFSETLPSKNGNSPGFARTSFVGRIPTTIGSPPAMQGWEDIVISIADDYFQRKIRSHLPDRLGWFHYKEDPFEVGGWVLPVKFRKDIAFEQTVDFLFFEMTWRHSTTVWPELWLRVRGEKSADGDAVVYSTVSLAGSNESEGKGEIFRIPDVSRLESETIPTKTYTFRIGF